MLQFMGLQRVRHRRAELALCTQPTCLVSQPGSPSTERGFHCTRWTLQDLRPHVAYRYHFSGLQPSTEVAQSTLRRMGPRMMPAHLLEAGPGHLVHFHALEKEMATHSSVLAWRISGAGPALLCLHFTV